MPQACKFIKKKTPAQVFSYEFCKIFKNNFFIEHFWTTTSRHMIEQKKKRQKKKTYDNLVL